MKEDSILDVLMYLFENYMDEDSQLQDDPDVLRQQLHDAGFLSPQIGKAFDWLEGLTKESVDVPALKFTTNNPIRVFSPEECKKLDVKSRGYLLFLEQIGVLAPTNRELVIDRVIALENEEVDIDQLKWIILMVMFNQTEFDDTFHWVENVVLEDHPINFH